MPETLTAPPVAPTGTPTTPKVSTPPPAAKVAPAPPMESKKGLQTPFDELDSMSKEVEIPTKPVDKVEPAVEEPKVEPVAEVKEPELIGEEEHKPEVKTDEKPMGTAKELRSAYDRVKKELSELKKQLETSKATKVEDPEKKTLLERLQQEETKRKQFESELSQTNFERTDEYKEKFEKPLQSAFQTAYEEIQQLEVETAEGKRKGTIEDFNKLMYCPLQEAISIATEQFGVAASEVLAHRRRIVEMNESRKKAVTEHSSLREQREKESLIAREQDLQNRAQLWDKTTKEQIEKFPQYFGPLEGDEEGNKVLEKGFKIADLAFSNPDMPIDQKIKLNASIRNKAGSFDRLAMQNRKLSEQLKAAQEEIASFKKSEPGVGEGSTDKVEDNSWQAEIDALATKR